MSRLYDGGYAPSWMPMSTTDTDTSYHKERVSHANSLREGYIVGRHFPGEEGFESEKRIIYEVLTFQYTVGRGGTPDRVRCELAEPFGSILDRGHQTLRSPIKWDFPKMTGDGDKDEQAVRNAMEELSTISTRVLVLFLDGRADRGVIVGCMPNEAGSAVPREDGHNLFSSFNGIETSINKDGEYTLTSTLETVDAETNKVADPDPDKAGSFIKIDKDGSVFLDAYPDYIAIDKANHNIEINASENTYIGSPVTSDQNLVLGQKLLTALTELLNYLKTPPLTGPAIPGQPLPMNPLLTGLLTTWAGLYLQQPPSPTSILAEKKFTE